MYICKSYILYEYVCVRKTMETSRFSDFPLNFLRFRRKLEPLPDSSILRNLYFADKLLTGFARDFSRFSFAIFVRKVGLQIQCPFKISVNNHFLPFHVFASNTFHFIPYQPKENLRINFT